MRTLIPPLLLVLAGLVAIALAHWGRQASRRATFVAAEHEGPEELRSSRRLAMPGILRMTRPFRLHGQPDHVYLTQHGTVVVREDKSSHRHIEAAIIQASVYAAILRHAPPPEVSGRRVESHFWLRVGSPGRSATHYLRVPLLEDRVLARLVDTYHALASGWNPSRTADASICRRRCPHFGNRCNGPRV